MFAEEGRHVPFPVRRIFTIYDVVAGATRGGHAHREQGQFLIMLSGGCLVEWDDGDAISTERLYLPTQGIYIPPVTWIVLKKFSPGAICLVLASGHYDEDDYIRDYAEFKQITSRR